MSVERIGSNWGGFWVDLDLIPRDSVAICAGIGNDTTFDEELIRRCGVTVIGLDPTQRAIEHIDRRRKAGLGDGYVFLPQALYGQSGVELDCQSFRSIFRGGGQRSLSVTLPDLWARYPGCSLVKLDIEGSEYPVLDALESVPNSVRQFCIEFHHRLPEVPFGVGDTERLSQKLIGMGFTAERLEKDYEDTLYTRR